MEKQLQFYCNSAFPDHQDVRIIGLRSISAGWESDVYSFDIEHGPIGERRFRELILRVYPGNDANEKSKREFRGMEQLYKAGYPVPEVFILERDNLFFDGPFMIMERINGEGFWPILVGATGNRQKELLTLFCRLLVQLHELDWHQFPEDTVDSDYDDPYRFIDRNLKKGREMLRTVLTLPGFIPIIQWLEERRDLVPCNRPSLIHWDFHPGNILFQKDNAAVVIDWTQICISDYRFDLAWTLLLMSTHENSEWRGLILKEYKRLSGRQIEQIEYFEVFACAKRLLSIVFSMTLGPEKLGMRPEAVDLMKDQMSAIRKVYNLLQERTDMEIPEVEEMLSRYHC